MDSRRVQQGTRRMPTRFEVTTADETCEEDDYDDEWPVRTPSSTRRYQRSADVRTEAGRTSDVQSSVSRPGAARATGEPHLVPPRRSATQASLPALPKKPSAPLPGGATASGSRGPASPRRQPARQHQAKPRRFHWLFFVGLALMAMVLGWFSLSALTSWWNTTLDDWHYGRPRTYQADAVVGHRDSAQNPSHFIAMNLNRHIIVIEMPGGDISRSIVYSGPTLSGQGQDLTPVTLSFQDVNHDGRPDMLINLQGNTFIFLNQNGTFVPSNQNLPPTSS